MQNNDISTLLTDALIGMGCDKKLIEELDAQADVVLDFEGLPSIHLSHDAHDVCLWSTLGERFDYQRLIDSHATPLMLQISQPQFYARGGAAAITVKDEGMQLFALVHPDYLADSEQFGVALNEFFGQLTEVNRIIGQ